MPIVSRTLPRRGSFSSHIVVRKVARVPRSRRRREKEREREKEMTGMAQIVVYNRTRYRDTVCCLSVFSWLFGKVAETLAPSVYRHTGHVSSQRILFSLHKLRPIASPKKKDSLLIFRTPNLNERDEKWLPRSHYSGKKNLVS